MSLYTFKVSKELGLTILSQVAFKMDSLPLSTCEVALGSTFLVTWELYPLYLLLKVSVDVVSKTYNVESRTLVN